MSGTLVLGSRQGVLRVDLRLLRQIVKAVLGELLEEERFDLGIYLVGMPEIVRLNETFLRHRGVTDVINFDYSERVGRGSRSFGPLGTARPTSRMVERAVPSAPPIRDACPALLHGEIFICAEEAVRQARRFGTTWQNELVRYVIHGLLHLRGFDDSGVRERRKMKKEEDRLLRALTGRFELRKLALRKAPRAPRMAA